jgi:16S rRNA (uracil1498-N3)-methyltransferase
MFFLQRKRDKMAMRIFQSIPLKAGTMIQLDSKASHHVAEVLRAKCGEPIVVFNGEGGEYEGSIISFDKKCVSVCLQRYQEKEVESPLELYLLQGISRGEKMDHTLQKATELGVKKIIPLMTARSTVKLDASRWKKKEDHWRSILIAACEQSGRNHLPELMAPQPFGSGLEGVEAKWRFILSPYATQKLSHFPIQPQEGVALLVGPEGGFSEDEMKLAFHHHYLPLYLGPRVLRTETAAIAAITVLQSSFGDMAR